MTTEKKPGESAYAKKRASGNMMYGPGCCAHTVTPAQINAARERARERGHFSKPAFVSTLATQRPMRQGQWEFDTSDRYWRPTNEEST